MYFVKLWYNPAVKLATRPEYPANNRDKRSYLP
jgi:hypothetical protein